MSLLTSLYFRLSVAIFIFKRNSRFSIDNCDGGDYGAPYSEHLCLKTTVHDVRVQIAGVPLMGLSSMSQAVTHIT